MDKSIFTNRKEIPDEIALKKALGQTFKIWNAIKDYTHEKFPASVSEWSFPGDKYGWSYRIKDKKRVIVYLLPRDHFFKIAMVFGPTATNKILLESDISERVKTELKSAKAYAEGRGIRIVVEDDTLLETIERMIDIKLSQ